MRSCRKCGETKPLRMFECTNVERSWYRRECKTCTNRRRRNEGCASRAEIARRQTYQRDYSAKHSALRVARATEWAKANPERRRQNALNYYYRLADQAIQAYGGYECSWCGIDDPICLVLDHIENNGAEERRQFKYQGASFYKWLRDRGYPKGYQVLCMNCNHGKMRNGGILPASLKGRCNDHPRKRSRAKRPEAPGTPKG